MTTAACGNGFTLDDHAAAVAEGWALFEADSVEMQIQRIDDPDDRPEPVFADDGDAWRHVVTRAREGSDMHRRALAAVSEEERERIRAACGEW